MQASKRSFSPIRPTIGRLINAGEEAPNFKLKPHRLLRTSPARAADRRRRVALLWIFLTFAATAAQAAPARLTEPEIRAFVARQSKAWNAGDLAGYFGLFTPDAAFTDQARARDGRLVTYGTSSVAQARVQARRTFAAAKVHEMTAVRAVTLAPDQGRATVTSAEVTTLAGHGAPRRVCAERVQSLVATPAGLRSKGQTDTVVRCR
jgi:hypothetical protein